ncbi:MAG TPA: universal stress protein [Gemmatimonadales bacterium]
MQLRHILAATDESEAGRQAVRTAVALAAQVSGRVSVLRVIPEGVPGRVIVAGPGQPPGERGKEDVSALAYLRRWLEAGVLSPDELAIAELAIASGLPGIEICRFAEQAQADLIVVGRKRHSPMARLLLGDTADAVARRSRVPCLFVPPGSAKPTTVLVALDGSERGMSVLIQACDFARDTGAAVTAVTVERRPAGEPLELVPAVPVTRSALLQTRVNQVLRSEGFREAPLTVGQGDVVERVVSEINHTGADILAIGYHRGGPPGIMEAGSNARRLAHVVPSAVLTIPL